MNPSRPPASWLIPADGYTQRFKVSKSCWGSDDPYLLQQMALYEMHRPSGNLSKAATYLEDALGMAKKSNIIKHSLAELHIKRADLARNDLRKIHSIAEAEQICRGLKKHASDSYAHGTLVKAGLLRLRRAASSEDVLKDEDVDGLIKSVENDLADGSAR